MQAGSQRLQTNVGPTGSAEAPDRRLSAFRYAAVIRAYQFTPALKRVAEALRAQSIPPQRIVIVDSSKDPSLLPGFRKLAETVVAYPDEEFNYSKALNIGHEAHDLPYTLNISSHMVLSKNDIIERGLKSAFDKDLEIVYWIHSKSGYPPTEDTLLDLKNFTGRNGMSNAFTMIPTQLLRARPFREEIFSAEDQEWTLYYLKSRGLPMLRVDTAEVSYQNPNHGDGTWSETKLLNEELAIGYYVNRRLLMPDRIIARLLRGLLAATRRRPERARLHLRYAWELTKANFVTPARKSRYF